MIKRYIKTFQRYSFLLGQLVSRDFKTRYKRSILGVMWSMLNPLLTMAVQYLVFANLFRWDIDNYAVYLLSGTVIFNFFSEATQQSLSAVTGSAALITKVYMPTYVFPVSKVLSAYINLGFSTIALYFIIFLQGMPLNIYHWFIPMNYLTLGMFSCGLGMILAALMVYFRDTQFIYNVLIVLWTYLTPLFYPISIIPDTMMRFYRLNPMYQYVSFFRTIILDAKLPTLEQFLYCYGYGIGMLIFGILVFRKMKRNFVFYV